MVKDHSDNEKGNLFDFSCATLSNVSYAASHIHVSTYHGFWYTNCTALAGRRNRSMVPSGGIDLMTHRTMSR